MRTRYSARSVANISADSLVDQESGETYYQVLVSTDAAAVFGGARRAYHDPHSAPRDDRGEGGPQAVAVMSPVNV